MRIRGFVPRIVWGRDSEFYTDYRSRWYVVGALASLVKSYYGVYDPNERKVKVIIISDLDGVEHQYYWCSSLTLFKHLKSLHSQNTPSDPRKPRSAPNHFLCHLLSILLKFNSRIPSHLTTLTLGLNFALESIKTHEIALSPLLIQKSVNLLLNNLPSTQFRGPKTPEFFKTLKAKFLKENLTNFSLLEKFENFSDFQKFLKNLKIYKVKTLKNSCKVEIFENWREIKWFKKEFLIGERGIKKIRGVLIVDLDIDISNPEYLQHSGIW